MTQVPDHAPGAYYVSVRHAGKTLLALGPFARHTRALGLVECVRMRVLRADLDPWAEFGYGTCRLPLEACPVPAGTLNDVFHVGPDWRGPLTAPARIAPDIITALREAA